VKANEEYFPFQTSLAKATIEEMRGHTGNAEDDKDLQYDEGRKECQSESQGSSTTVGESMKSGAKKSCWWEEGEIATCMLAT
jgi:hypothetical protein